MHKVVVFDSDGMLTHGPRFSEQYSKDQGIDINLMIPFFTGPFKDCLVGKADVKDELQKGWLEKWGWEKGVDEFMDYWFSVGDTLDDRVYDSIKTVRETGVVCVLATNQEKYRTDYLTSKFEYDSVFQSVFSSAYVGFKKPTQEFFLYILSNSIPNEPVAKSEVLFWDDDTENIEGAHNFGVDTRQYTDFETYSSEMMRLGLL